MNVMDVVGTIGAIWLAISILLAIAWALGGKRIFRQPPAPRGDIYEPIDDTTTGVITELNRRNRMNGGAL